MLVKENFSLKNYNTFHLDVTAGKFVEVFSEDELIQFCGSSLKSRGCLVLGGGSNILLMNDQEIVLKISIYGIEQVDENEDYVYIRVGAGVVWNELVNYSVERNLGGIENLILIPGTVGAAPIQNIGAYGQELKDTFHSLNALHLDECKISTFMKNDCNFGYRTSIFKNELKNRAIISSITLKLKKNPSPNLSYSSVKELLEKENLLDKATVKDVSRIITKIRKSKLPDPEVIGNAGSFFKNPEINMQDYEILKERYPTIPAFKTFGDGVKIAAGWLIEQCGWKGKREGDTGSHKDQALVLVNYGLATGRDILDFSTRIKNSVFEKFGITLEEEVNIV
jgi:UDP-N-acetylmuramate dehydrogenase